MDGCVRIVSFCSMFFWMQHMPMEAPLSVEACVDQYAGKVFRSIDQT